MLCRLCRNFLEGALGPKETRNPGLLRSVKSRSQIGSCARPQHASAVNPESAQNQEEDDTITIFEDAHHMEEESLKASAEGGCVMCNRIWKQYYDSPRRRQDERLKMDSSIKCWKDQETIHFLLQYKWASTHGCIIPAGSPGHLLPVSGKKAHS